MKIEVGAEWLYRVIDVSLGDVTVVNGPCLVRLVYVNIVTSAHVITLEDNSVAIFSLPATTSAGVTKGFGDARFETDLVVNVDPAATGNITVVYKPNNEGFAGPGA